MGRATFSAVVVAPDEQTLIGRCLASLGWCEEVIPVDTENGDATRARVEGLATRVVPHPLVAHMELVRNAGIACARGDWILVVDADETIPPPLAGRLRAAEAVVHAREPDAGGVRPGGERFLTAGGYRDGRPGLVLSVLLASYRLQVEAKVWQTRGAERFERGFSAHTYELGRFVDHLLNGLAPARAELRIHPRQGTGDPRFRWGARENIVYELLR